MAALRKSVLLGGGFLMDEVRARLESGCDTRVLPDSEGERDAFLARHGGEFEGAIATSASGEMMDETPNLKIIACYGVGYDGIDADAAARRGIWVSNTPDVLNDDVADLAIGLMLAVVRRIPAAQCFAKHEWSSGGSFPLTDRLTGRRLGMLGMGRIGGAIVRRGAGVWDGNILSRNRSQAGFAASVGRKSRRACARVRCSLRRRARDAANARNRQRRGFAGAGEESRRGILR